MKKRYLSWIFASLFAGIAIYASFENSKAVSLENSVENNYNRAFYELVNYVDDVRVLLDKSMLVSSPAQIASISSELFRKTTAAKACLAQIPIGETSLENTEKFLSQIGDYTYSLSQKAIYGEKIEEKDYENLSSLGDFAEDLNNELLILRDEISSGDMSFTKMKKGEKKGIFPFAKAEETLSGFEKVEKKFQEYPSLIYDGPFSEHIEKMNPVMTEGKKTISKDEALKKAEKFLDKDQIVPDGESFNTALESYLFKSNNEEENIYAAFTKKGGYPLYFLKNRDVETESISVEQAREKAKKFLYDKGFYSMEASYYDKQNGVATINFFYNQGGIVCYSDLIKVKVSLDDGEIVGFEAAGYLMSHKQRDFSEVKISEEEAREKINSHLDIQKIRLALIPKENKEEVLCYEVSGKYKDKNFLIYINAENGREEKILMLLESEDGILTV